MVLIVAGLFVKSYEDKAESHRNSLSEVYMLPYVGNSGTEQNIAPMIDRNIEDALTRAANVGNISQANADGFGEQLRHLKEVFLPITQQIPVGMRTINMKKHGN